MNNWIILKIKINVCKIIKENGGCGTGFLLKFTFLGIPNYFPVLITCYHVLEEGDILPGKKISLIFNNEQK